MKWTVLAFLFTLFGADISFGGGAEVGFQWIQPPNSTWGTKLYIGTSPGDYTYTSDAGGSTNVDCPEGECTFTQGDLQYNQKYYFAATHFDANGFESELAPEVSWTSPEVPGISFNPPPEITDSGVKTYQLILQIPTN